MNGNGDRPPSPPNTYDVIWTIAKIKNFLSQQEGILQELFSRNIILAHNGGFSIEIGFIIDRHSKDFNFSVVMLPPQMMMTTV